MDINLYRSQLSNTDKIIFDKNWNIIKQHCPKCIETISYGMPTLKYNNRSLISLAIWSRFFSIYPNIQFSKAAINFAKDKQIPKSLLKQIIKIRMNEITKS